MPKPTRTTARRGFRIRRPEPKPRRITTPRHRARRRRRRAAQHDGPLARTRPPLTAVVPQQMHRKRAASSTPARPHLDAASRCVSGTEVIPETKCRDTTPHPTHPARHPRHESDGRVAQGPEAASRDQQTNHDPHQHERLPIGPRSHRRPPHTSFSATTPYQQQSRRSHASEMSYRSSPDGVGPQSELAVLPRPPNFSMPLDALASRQSAPTSRPSLTPNGISPRRHHTHLALDGLPSFQRRGSPDSWCVDDVPCRPRRPKVSARADEQR